MTYREMQIENGRQTALRIGNMHTTTVEGTGYEFWGDMVMRGTFAMNTETGEIKRIKESGYIHKDLTVRKAIAAVFGHDTFRK